MMKILMIFILCISTKSFSQLASNARNGNISAIKNKEGNTLTIDSVQKNVIVLNSMGRFAKPMIINKMDTTKKDQMISEKKQPQLLSTKRKQE
ncbi:hypothetical protein J2X97_000597 [Epilithonimonas hungarica]|uniref:hypothetical protein n=1 Tax=Epilithonimonas hungarica TaxID=454006 RepID=UPI00278A0140|nr:hypothetical protein [Epilithonimonas hungarica]MDP9954960.1 hypothetical protein [Epilithonimonas hungarica]